MALVKGGNFPISISGLSCTANEMIGDAVYFSSANTVSRANALNISFARVVGFIESKQSATSCTIKTSGFISLSGLTSYSQYFLSETDGQISTSIPIGTGKVIVKLGISQSATKFLINISPERVVRA